MGTSLSKIGSDPGDHWCKSGRQFLREPTVQTHERAKEFRRRLSLYAGIRRGITLTDLTEAPNTRALEQIVRAQQRMLNSLWLYALTDRQIFWQRGFEARREELKKAIKACIKWEALRYLKKGKAFKAALIRHYAKGMGLHHFKQAWDRVPRDFNIDTPMPGGQPAEETCDSHRSQIRDRVERRSGRAGSSESAEAWDVKRGPPPPYTEVDERHFYR